MLTELLTMRIYKNFTIIITEELPIYTESPDFCNLYDDRGLFTDIAWLQYHRSVVGLEHSAIELNMRLRAYVI